MRVRAHYHSVDEFVEWVQDRDYYQDQIQFQRDVPARSPVTEPLYLTRHSYQLLSISTEN